MLVPVGAPRGSRKTLKPQEDILVFWKFSVIDCKPQQCTKQCVWMGRDTPLILAAMSHGGWITSPQHNQFSNNKFSSWQKEICCSSTQSCIPSKGACLKWRYNHSPEHRFFSKSCSDQTGCPHCRWKCGTGLGNGPWAISYKSPQASVRLLGMHLALLPGAVSCSRREIMAEIHLRCQNVWTAPYWKLHLGPELLMLYSFLWYVTLFYFLS